MLMSVVLLVYATLRTANCVALAILISIKRTNWLMTYVAAEVMPASVFAHPCKLLYTKPMLTRNCSVTRQSSRTSSTSGTEYHTVLVRSRVQLQETVSAGTGSCGVSCLSSLF